MRWPDPDNVAHCQSDFNALRYDSLDDELKCERGFPEECLAHRYAWIATISDLLATPFLGLLIQRGDGIGSEARILGLGHVVQRRSPPHLVDRRGLVSHRLPLNQHNNDAADALIDAGDAAH
jgi:hypothetical protein